MSARVEWLSWVPPHVEVPDPPADPLATAQPDAWWKLNEAPGATALIDATGHGNTLTPVGPSGTLGVPGAHGTALNLPGGGYWVTTPTPGVDRAWTRVRGATLCAWVKVPNSTTSRSILAFDDVFTLGYFSGKARVNYTVGGGNSFVAGVKRIDDGSWHHLAVTEDGLTYRLYVDGVFEGQSARAGNYAVAANPNIRLGFGGYTTMIGTVDDAAAFGRVLTLAEIVAVAASGPPPGSDAPPTDPDPVPVPVPGAWVRDDARTEALVAFTAGHGRADANTKPSPATCTLQLAAQFAPVAPVPGERVRLQLTEAACTELGLALDAEARVRFTGEVTDAVTDNPKRLADRRHQVTAVGRWARGSRYLLDPSGYPRESAAARVARILAAAPAAEPGDVDPDPTVLGRLDARLTAGQLVDAVMESTGSLLVETRTGALDWHGPDHRRGATPVLTLDALEVFRDGFTWQRRLSDIVNDVTVQLLDGSTIRLRDGFSEDAHGPSPVTVGTQLVDASDAYSLAQLILSRRARPSWQLPAVEVDVLRTVSDPVKRRLLLALTTGDRLTITGLPPSPDAEAITALDVFVEGVTERLALSPGRHDTPARKVWRLTFAVADSALSGATLRWLDVPADVTWGDVDPTISWLDLGRIENPADLT